MTRRHNLDAIQQPPPQAELPLVLGLYPLDTETPTPAKEPNISAEFDAFAGSYKDLLDRSTRLAGEGGEYFAELKAVYLANLLGRSFRGKVLDFGCGVGLLSRFLLLHLPGCQLDGYDISPTSLAGVPVETSSRGKFTSLLSELDANYDVIVVANVMHHIGRNDRQRVINDLQRRLGNGGSLVAFEHNPLNPLTRLAVKQCPFDSGAVLLWPRELRMYFNNAGLSLQRRDYITFFPRVLSGLRPLESKLAWCAAGAQYVVVGRNGSPARA